MRLTVLLEGGVHERQEDQYPFIVTQMLKKRFLRGEKHSLKCLLTEAEVTCVDVPLVVVGGGGEGVQEGGFKFFSG